MMEKEIIWFASANKHKIKEVTTFLALYGYQVKSLLDINYECLIIENGKNYRENALIKAKALAAYTKEPTLGEDSGLEVMALDGFPGLYSKRWKSNMSYEEAMQKIITSIKSSNNYQAKMVSVFAYINPKQQLLKTFTGVLEGELLDYIPEGENSFGYDKIFLLPELKQTLHQLGLTTKNLISHRAQALKKFMNYLKNINHK